MQKKRPEVPPPERAWTEAEVEMWWLVERCWAHEPSTRPDIRLVKNFLEALTVNRRKKPTSCSPSPSVAEDINQDIIAAREIVKAQGWIREQMGSTNFQDLSERRADDLPKIKAGIVDFYPNALSC